MCLIDPFHSHNASWEPLRKPENTATTQETHKHNQAEGMAYQHPWCKRECYSEVMVAYWLLKFPSNALSERGFMKIREFIVKQWKHKCFMTMWTWPCVCLLYLAFKIISEHFYLPISIEEADSVDHISGQGMLVRQSVVWGATTDHWPQPAIDPSLN